MAISGTVCLIDTASTVCCQSESRREITRCKRHFRENKGHLYLRRRKRTLTLSGTGYTPTYSGNDTPFYQCTTIKHIVIEEGVTSLRQWLFYELTGVESVSIPSTVTSIDRDAFAGTSVIGDGFTVSADNTEFTSVEGSLFNKNKTILYKYTE